MYCVRKSQKRVGFMRRYLKKRLKSKLKDLILVQLNLIETLNEEYVAVVKTGQFKEYTEYMEQKFTEYQDLVIKIGTQIEEVEGEDTQAVAFLTQYCDLIYFANVILQKKDIPGVLKNLQLMNSCLENTIEKIESELSDEKIEIVILPYKAAMWDSLETVWMAANEDPECNVQVVPIPYYDKNPDGTFKEMHYEGEQYPTYVPIVDWRNINLDQLHPDVIYFHNPYDSYNFVTSVHPDFYSSKLKRETDMLVYIPYFVSDDDVEEHFCRSIGIFHSTRVIVQSEKIRETYKRVYIESIGEKQREAELKGAPLDSQFWESLNKQADEKFLSIGSPKFDRVVDSKFVKENIPIIWEQLYFKDGERKNLLLYNTTLQAFLDYRESYLLKLENVLSIFEKRDDIVLLWRPHPLLMTTIESMSPELSIRYRQIVKEFKDKGYGIYDDSSDLNRAINISDAYYGDMSSVVTLYKYTKKPILIQNVTLLEEEI